MEKILSVDDSRIMRKMISGAVASLGYEFLEAPSGDEALTVLRDHGDDVKLILLDINMPGMNGLETLEAIKADPTLSRIPVVMVTTEACRSMVIGAVKAGAANYVTKPFTQEELTTRMVESLGLVS
jgi:two-component system chemotaxis response regulator CheY